MIPPLAPPAPSLGPEIKETSRGDRPNMTGTIPLDGIFPILLELNFLLLLVLNALICFIVLKQMFKNKLITRFSQYL